MASPGDTAQPSLLLIFDNLEYSGVAKLALDLLRTSEDEVSRGFSFSGLVCMANHTGQALEESSLHFANPHMAPDAPIWIKPLLGLRAVLACARLAREADLLVGITPPAAFVALCAGWLSGKTPVAWVHYDIMAWQREMGGRTRSPLSRGIEYLFYRWIVPRFRNIVFVSDACRDSMRLATGKSAVPVGQNWAVIPNMFNPRGFSAAVRTPELDRVADWRGNGKRILLFVGRLSRQKRWGHAIDTMEGLRIDAPELKLLMIGDGPDRERFLVRLGESPARDSIAWIDRLPDPDLAYALADVLIMTSLYEAWPVVILEAFDHGLPVVSYRCPSGPEAMLAEGRGILCDESPEAMAASIRHALALPPGELAALRERARLFLRRHHPDVVLPLWLRHARLSIAGSR
jgi:glycosyltransferase involved in cell wall biosynthesis